jgi:hypothetical protein
MLGYTNGTLGNTVQDLLSMIDRSVAADGSTRSSLPIIYYMNNTADPLRNVRACGSTAGCSTPTLYNDAAARIQALGASATVAPGILPPNGATNIAGIMTGNATLAIPSAGFTLANGAFADHLTSWAALFDCSAGCQTPVSAWIKQGASGSEGAVEEPCPLPAVFPSANFHYYYVQGMSLGEAYLRSLQLGPTHNLLYGDPLTRAFAYIPNVSLISPPVGNQSGVITLTPSATTSRPGARIAGYDLLVDGVKMGSAVFGNTLTLDTHRLPDGRHDLRVMAYDNTPVRNVGRWIATLDTSNYGHAAALSVLPSSGNLVQRFTFAYSATGGTVTEVQLLQNGRVLAASSAASGSLTVYGQNLGAGTSNVRLQARYTDNHLAQSAPVSVTVTSDGTPAGAAPIAYSYSKFVTSSTPFLVELPASFDAGPNTVTYRLLGSPTKATILQSGFSSSGPYRIIQPISGSNGTEQLQFQVTTPAGTSNVATVTLNYTRITTFPAPTNVTDLSISAGLRTQQVGAVTIAGNTHASLWSTSAESWVDLNPQGAISSIAYGTDGKQQVGAVSVGDATHGALWAGSAASWIDLSPPGSVTTVVRGVSSGQQVGFATIGAKPHASLWTGSANSWVDLSPAGTSASSLSATNGVNQVGTATVGGTDHAGLWTGTASSWVDLHPTGATASAALGMSDNRQVGYAVVNGSTHASLWLSTPLLWMDLNPAASTYSMAVGTDISQQVGFATVGGVVRASLWTNGFANSWVDLSASLPPQYTGFTSWAYSISSDALGTVVVGYALRSGGTDVVIWEFP